MKTLFLICATLLISASLHATDDIPKPQEGTSTVSFSIDKDGNKNVLIHNRIYLFQDTVYLSRGPSPKPTAFLIAEDQTSTEQMLSDTPPTPKLKAQAWAAQDGFPNKFVWTLDTDGNSGAIEDRFYAVTQDGFEDDFPTYTYFRMADGKKAFASNTQLLTVYSSDDDPIPRYIGFRDQFADNELPKALVDKKITGIVSYGDEHGVTKKIAIYGWPSDDKPSPPNSYLSYEKSRVEDREVYLRANKETGTAALSHFSIVIVLGEEIEVEIPFENDAPQLDHARLPKGYSLELLP